MKPLKIRVRNTWQGKVGIRDKHIKAAKKSGQSLLLVVGQEQMTIPNREIDSMTVATSEFPFVDYFSKEMHYLIYFIWKPDKDNQTKLF